MKRSAFPGRVCYQRFALAIVHTAVGRPAVTLPLVGDEVGEVVLQEHAGCGGVAPGGGAGGAGIWSGEIVVLPVV